MIERIINVRLDGGANTQEYVLDQANLAKLNQVRGSIMEADSARLSIGGNLLLHSKLPGLASLYASGNMAIVRSVSYPNPNQSHFVSTDIIHEGRYLESSSRPGGVLTGSLEAGGWFARYLEDRFPNYPVGFPNATDPHPIGMSLDYNQTDVTRGVDAVYDYATPNPSVSSATIQGATDLRASDPIGRAADYIITTKSKRDAYNNVVKSLHDTGVNNASYPAHTFGKRLGYIGRQINAGSETYIYNVRLGGFDTHSQQVAQLPTLLQQLDTLEVLVDDLTASGKMATTAILVYTEFGRTLRSNASAGTDHGIAWDCFILGPSAFIGANKIIGNAISFDPVTLGTGTAVPMQYDFRDIYATLLKKGFGATVASPGITNLFNQLT